MGDVSVQSQIRTQADLDLDDKNLYHTSYAPHQCLGSLWAFSNLRMRGQDIFGHGVLESAEPEEKSCSKAWASFGPFSLAPSYEKSCKEA